MAGTRCNAVSVVAGTVGLLAFMGRGNEPASPDSRIQELQNRIAALEAQQPDQLRDVAAAIDQVLRDADRRSQLLATRGDVSAGYDGGFFIRAGQWSMRPSVWFQFRYVTDFREEVSEEKDDETEDGFEMRRLRFDVDGTAFSEKLEYSFSLDSDQNTGGVSLLDAWARYMFSTDWGFQIGQFKDPVSHEYLTSSRRQLAVDRSLADSLLGGTVGGRTQGILAIYGNRNPANPFALAAGVTDGANQLNTDFQGRGTPLPDPEPTVGRLGKPLPHTVDWGIAGRAEYKVLGDWPAYKDFTAKGTKRDLLVLGAGGDWSQGGDGDLVLATGDVQYENAHGLGLYGAVLHHHVAPDGGESSGDWGLIAQTGHLLTPEWEIFARYDVILLDDPIRFANGGDEDAVHEITVGVNRYLGVNGSAGHRAKITLDLTYLPNSAPRAQTGLGILNGNEGNGEWVFRAQFQLSI